MYKFLGKDKRIYICIHDRVGAKANTLSPVWNMGFHIFDTEFDGTRTYRLVYFKNKHARYYSEITIPIKDAVPICEG